MAYLKNLSLILAWVCFIPFTGVAGDEPVSKPEDPYWIPNKSDRTEILEWVIRPVRIRLKAEWHDLLKELTHYRRQRDSWESQRETRPNIELVAVDDMIRFHQKKIDALEASYKKVTRALELLTRLHSDAEKAIERHSLDVSGEIERELTNIGKGKRSRTFRSKRARLTWILKNATEEAAIAAFNGDSERMVRSAVKVTLILSRESLSRKSAYGMLQIFHQRFLRAVRERVLMPGQTFPERVGRLTPAGAIFTLLNPACFRALLR